MGLEIRQCWLLVEKAGTRCPSPELCVNTLSPTVNPKVLSMKAPIRHNPELSRAASAALRHVSTIRGDKTSWPKTCRRETWFPRLQALGLELPGLLRLVVLGSGMLGFPRFGSVLFKPHSGLLSP